MLHSARASPLTDLNSEGREELSSDWLDTRRRRRNVDQRAEQCILLATSLAKRREGWVGYAPRFQTNKLDLAKDEGWFWIRLR